jgi:hypothetical protein
MKISLAQIVNSQEALQRLAAEKLPVKLSYAIARAMRKIQPELEQYEKTRADLIKDKYGTAREGGYQVEPENIEPFTKELIELQSVEVELDVWPIRLADFYHDMTAADMFVLDWLFTDE